MFATQKTLDDLGYPHLLRALAARCRTPMGKVRALTRPFLETPSEVDAALALVAEARAVIDEPLSLPVGGLEDVRPSVERAGKHALLEPRELAAISQLLSAFIHTRETVESRGAHLAALGRRLPLLTHLADRLAEAFEPSGELSDQAGPELRAARERARGLHRAIKSRLDDLLRNERFATHLRDAYYSVRHERYVVPVLAASRAEVPGIVHNASQSGQTLFVEPQQLIGLGNDLAIAQSLVLEEERRILQELTDEVGEHQREISEGVEAVAALDEAEAAAHLMADLNAHIPAREPPEGALELSGLRHPLLVLGGVAAVPNDLRLVPPLRALVVSGPNAGGKTVTLTGVGQCALMVKAGLPIPAGPDSRIPLFRTVHAAVGDAQDLRQGLSTFSAHVSQLRDIVAQVVTGSLVLVDEIAADTDPREGAALAIAVLEELLGHGAVALVTTHLEEVKALAHMDPRFQNARVGFDPAKSAPTYRLQLGLAGRSSAIEVAAGLGLPQAIIERARTLTREAEGPLSRALAAAEDERRRLLDEQAAAEAATAQARMERDRAENERVAQERRAAEMQAEHEARLKAALDAAAEELRSLIASLREKPTLKAASDVRAEVMERADAAEARAEAARNKASPTVAAAPVPLVPGTRARHRRLKQMVEVLEVDGAEALVAAGPMKMRVPLSDLTGIAGEKPARRFPAQPSSAESFERAEALAPGSPEPAESRCDVRGMRAEDALREVERFLDRTFGQGRREAVILHGHGTGALKQSIRAHLDESPYVRMFRPGVDHEGGDAVTVVAFRG
jgi:DNA mismatch repair protein MutS2